MGWQIGKPTRLSRQLVRALNLVNNLKGSEAYDPESAYIQRLRCGRGGDSWTWALCDLQGVSLGVGSTQSARACIDRPELISSKR